MSFHPLSPGIDQSLLGVGANPDLIDISRYINRDFVDRAHYLAKEGNNMSKLVLTVIISAIIFVTVVAIYDVIRNVINNYYAMKALTNPEAENSEHEINSTLIANNDGFISSMVFAGICIAIAAFVLYFAWPYLKR